jgi:hypothetical protein
MCKHVAAVLYGVGARLDERPELLFLLRLVDHLELLETAATSATVGASRRRGKQTIAGADLADVFGIEIAADSPAPAEDAAVAVERPPRRRLAAAALGQKVRRRDATPKAPPPKPKHRRVPTHGAAAERGQPESSIAARKKPRAAARNAERKPGRRSASS